MGFRLIELIVLWSRADNQSQGQLARREFWLSLNFFQARQHLSR